MRLLYLSTKDFSNKNSDGVVKKILNQISAFEKNAFLVDYSYINTKDKTVHFVSTNGDNVIGRYNVLSGVFCKKIIGDYLSRHLINNRYECVYIRFLDSRTDPWHLKILSVLKKYDLKIVLEIPTYPYDDEGSKFETYIDRCFRWRLKRYVDKVVTYSPDKQIYGINTISIYNGIDVSSIKERNILTNRNNNTINIIAVASFEVAHGYERMIESLSAYYENKGDRNIIFHMVGDGVDKPLYERLVSEHKLEDKVIFYGKCFGQELDDVYDKANIAIGCLALYKKNLAISSALKVREYLAKGLPVVSGCTEDVLEDKSSDFYLRFPNDDSLIDIESVVLWYDELVMLYGGEENLNMCIRRFAFDNIDMNATLKEVIEFYEKESI